MPFSDFNIFHKVNFCMIHEDKVSSTGFVQPSPCSLRCSCTHLEGVLWHNQCPNLQGQSSNGVHSWKLLKDPQNHPRKRNKIFSIRDELGGEFKHEAPT